MACPTNDLLCECLWCGLSDIGVRDCECAAGVWSCTVCEYPPWFQPPPQVPECRTEADKVPCTTQGSLCAYTNIAELCMCWPDDEGALVWDCDSPPPGVW
jgi:hypothetical protein